MFNFNRITAAIMLTGLLSACGGGDSGGADPSYSGTLTKSGYWYGEQSYIQLNQDAPQAVAECNECSNQNFTYTWQVDMDDDGVFDGEADVEYQQASYAPNRFEYAKSVRLIATHDEIKEPLMVDYHPPQDMVNTVFSHKEGFGFAALKLDGTAIAWGNEEYGQANANELKNIKTIFTNRYTFAVLKDDGTVYTWDEMLTVPALIASDSSGVKIKLNNVVSITSNESSMAALKSDGTVVTWGSDRYGAQSLAEDTLVKDVEALFSTRYAYAALTNDDTVITWGNKRYGGDSNVIFENSGSSGGPEADTFTDNLTPVVNIKTIVGNDGAFAALTHDGKVITWGHGSYGGDVTYNNDQSIPLTGIDAIYAADRAFAAVNSEGEVITWGDNSGGDSNLHNSKTLDNVKTIVSGQHGFAALKTDGSIAAWGDLVLSEESNATGPLTNIIELYSSYHIGFAGINQNREAVYWGYQGDGTCSEQQPLVDIDTIVPSVAAYAAITYSANVITWGLCSRGGDSSVVNQDLQHIQNIYTSQKAFAAVKLDGTSVVTWGEADYGGDSSTVKDLLATTKHETEVKH